MDLIKFSRNLLFLFLFIVSISKAQFSGYGNGGQGFNYRGAWAANTLYNPYDVFSYNGSTYEVPTAFTSGTSFSASGLNVFAAAGTGGGGVYTPVAGVPSGTVNGTNAVFTLSSVPVTGSLLFQVNGLPVPASLYSLSGSTVTLTNPPATGDVLYANWQNSTTVSYTPYSQTPSGTVNGSNNSFTLSYAPVSASLVLQNNGQILTPSVGYTLSGTTITFTTPPTTGDIIYATYVH